MNDNGHHAKFMFAQEVHIIVFITSFVLKNYNHSNFILSLTKVLLTYPKFIMKYPNPIFGAYFELIKHKKDVYQPSGLYPSWIS